MLAPLLSQMESVADILFDWIKYKRVKGGTGDTVGEVGQEGRGGEGRRSQKKRRTERFGAVNFFRQYLIGRDCEVASLSFKLVILQVWHCDT